MMGTRGTPLAVVTLALAGACGSGSAGEDAPYTDADRSDAGSIDAGSGDGSPGDAGGGGDASVDANHVDAGLVVPAPHGRIAAAFFNTCMLTTANGMKCWGNNFYGELGNGTSGSSATSLVPVDVFGLVGGVVTIGNGFGYSCALLSGGPVRCWGNSAYIGEQPPSSLPLPDDVPDFPAGGLDLAATSSHVCAVTSSGGAKCWGQNQHGALGTGTMVHHWTPTDVVGLDSGVIAVGAGGNHACAVLSDGTVKCWGWNVQGQLGNAMTVDSLVPVDVVGLDGVTAIAPGTAHTCALLQTGAVKCWGSNQFGQLGNATSGSASMPTDVVGLPGPIASISAGDGHNCVVTTTGAAWCWGLNTYGALGNGTTTHSYMPVPVTGLGAGVLDVGAGVYHSCALMIAGGAKCWGYNSSGMLGDGTTTDHLVPVDVVGFED